MSSRLPVLDPMAAIASGVGPTKVRPDSRQERAKAAFSARKPYPGWTRVAPVFRAAESSAGTDR